MHRSPHGIFGGWLIRTDMIEVEIRGPLTPEEAQKLKDFLQKNGEFVESHTREMIRLYDYPGFAEDSLTREVDIRLRDTDGQCEIMVKKKMSENNVGRSELSLELRDTNLETAKAVMKALGYSKGLWMHRKKDVYRHSGIEWSIVEAPENIFYYEAEQEAEDGGDLQKVETHLKAEAEKMQVKVFTPGEYREFIAFLTEKVNKRIKW